MEVCVVMKSDVIYLLQ